VNAQAIARAVTRAARAVPPAGWAAAVVAGDLLARRALYRRAEGRLVRRVVKEHVDWLGINREWQERDVDEITSAVGDVYGVLVDVRTVLEEIRDQEPEPEARVVETTPDPWDRLTIDEGATQQ
jgi:hypothetical protein